MTHPEDKTTAGYQSWKKLAFLHWRTPAAGLQRLLPEGLQIEEFDGTAWLGLVPFSMERVRPWWSPPVPGISWFLETNVRTYVVDRQGVSGVWFFSLDANNRLAVTIARKFWHLPYRRASMSLCSAQGSAARYKYVGKRQELSDAEYDIEIHVDSAQPPQTASQGTLEHFLLERYVLFAPASANRLATGVVHHEPYQFRPVISSRVSQTLTRAEGLNYSADRPPDHAVYSDGVEVRVSPLQKAEWC